MYYVGIDIGGMSIKVGFVDINGKIISKYTIPIIPDEPQEETIINLAKSVNEHAKENNFEISGIGIGCPGSIDSINGLCDYSNNLNWNNLDIVGIIEKYCGVKAKITNDANAAILGEAKFGIAKNYHNVVMLTLGTGVGGGLYINDKLYEGNLGKGAELGHALFRYNGRQCTCGRKGCIEAYCSASALIADTKKAMRKDRKSKMWDYCEYDLNRVNGRTAFDCAQEGDKTAIKVVNNYYDYLATAIIIYCNIFRPEAVVIGGGISNQKDNLIKPLEKRLVEQHYGYKCTPKVELLIASLGNDAGLLGAAALVM